MGFRGRFLIVSFIVLLGSIYIYNSIDLNTHDDIKIYAYLKAMDVALAMDSMFKFFNFPGFYRGYEERFSNHIFSKVDRSGLNIETKKFDGVEVFTFDPVQREKNGPAIIYFHGGGWAYLDPKFYSHMSAEIARRLNLLVVSVNYRRSLEHPFPIPANDALTAAKFFFKNAEKFDVNPNRIALMGDSAGGNLAVVVGYQLSLLKKTEKNARVPKILVPLCSSFQMADLTFPAMRRENKDRVLTKEIIYWAYCTYAFGELSKEDIANCMSLVSTNSHLSAETVEKVRNNVDWKKYLSGSDYDNVPKSTFKSTPNKVMKKFSELLLNPMYSPLSALDNSELSILPPVYLLVSSVDLLLDDSRLMAERLKKVGRLGGYKEFNHYHISFILAPFKSEKSQNALNELIGFFEGKSIL